MSSVNQCHYFRGLKLLINHEVHEEHEAKPILKGLRVLCVLRGDFRVIARILRKRRVGRANMRALRLRNEGSRLEEWDAVVHAPDRERRRLTV